MNNLNESEHDMSDTIELPTLNTSLLVELLTWAGRSELPLPGDFEGWPKWEQSTWFRSSFDAPICQTAACMAGEAAMHDGDWVIDAFVDSFDDTVHDRVVRPGYSVWAVPVTWATGAGWHKPCEQEDGPGPCHGGWRSRKVRDKTRHHRTIESVGQEKIGLTDNEAIAFFNGSNTLEDLLHLAGLFAEERGVDLDLHPDLVVYLEDNPSRWITDERDEEGFVTYYHPNRD